MNINISCYDLFPSTWLISTIVLAVVLAILIYCHAHTTR